MAELIVATRSDQGAAGEEAWPTSDEAAAELLTSAVQKLTQVVNALGGALEVTGTFENSQGSAGTEAWLVKDDAVALKLVDILTKLNETLEVSGSVEASQGNAGATAWPVEDSATGVILTQAVDRLSTIIDRLGEVLDIQGTVDARDSGEREYEPIIGTATLAGPTTIHTPAAGKRIRLRWITCINDPNAEESTKISVYLGAKGVYSNWVISKRQYVTGPVDGPLIVDLSVAGDVAVNAMIEEI